MQNNSKTALIVGSSGLVGSELLQLLVKSDDYVQIRSLVRKPLENNDNKVVETVIDFDHLSQYKDLFNVDDVFCCLGTTIKKAGNQSEFKKVDVDYPFEIAKLAKMMNVQKFSVISSIGANPNSKIFYSRMKGLMEKQLTELELNSLNIFRPSLLLGDRKEYRFGEKFSGFMLKILSFLFIGKLKKYRAIEAKTVAMAMLKNAQLAKNGVHIFSSETIAKI